MRELYKTDIEKIMYDALLKEKIKFCFQFPIRIKYGYIVDFYFPEDNLIVECDGEKWHTNKIREKTRDFLLKERGFKILHFTGTEILEDINFCIKQIKQKLKGGITK